MFIKVFFYGPLAALFTLPLFLLALLFAPPLAKINMAATLLSAAIWLYALYLAQLIVCRSTGLNGEWNMRWLPRPLAWVLLGANTWRMATSLRLIGTLLLIAFFWLTFTSAQHEAGRALMSWEWLGTRISEASAETPAKFTDLLVVLMTLTLISVALGRHQVSVCVGMLTGRGFSFGLAVSQIVLALLFAVAARNGGDAMIAALTPLDRAIGSSAIGLGITFGVAWGLFFSLVAVMMSTAAILSMTREADVLYRALAQQEPWLAKHGHTLTPRQQRQTFFEALGNMERLAEAHERARSKR